MIMKRTLFIMVLLMGAIATFTQEEKSGVVDQLLHEQAVKALEIWLTGRMEVFEFYIPVYGIQRAIKGEVLYGI